MGSPGTICKRHEIIDKERVIAVVSDTLAGNDHVVFAYLFGSISRGNATPMSDIDIAVYLQDLQDMAEVKLDILGRLMHGLETDDVDLVILKTAPLTLQARVIRNRVVLKDGNPFQRHAFESLWCLGVLVVKKLKDPPQRHEDSMETAKSTKKLWSSCRGGR